MTLPDDPKLHFKNHLGLVRGKKLKRIWMVPWFATVWSIWLARNKGIFQLEGFDLLNVLDQIKIRSWHWTKIKIGGNFSFSDWCFCPVDV